MSLVSSSAQRARRDSQVGNSSGFNVNVKVGAVPSQRLRQTHLPNKAWTSVARRLPCGKGAGARNCSCVTLDAASNIFAFDQALYLYRIRISCLFMETSLALLLTIFYEQPAFLPTRFLLNLIMLYYSRRRRRRRFDVFQSTLPMKGVTPGGGRGYHQILVSIHTPNEGSDQQGYYSYNTGRVSIHTPNEGSDVF